MMQHVMTGVVFLILGLITLLYPSIFEKFYQLGLSEPSARALVQSLIGGTEIAVGIGLIWARQFGFDIETLLLLCALILMTIATLRIVTMIGWRAVSPIGAIEVTLECVWAAWLNTKARVYQQDATE